MKVYWVTVGLGVLVAVFGLIAYNMSDHQFGFMMILGGMVVAALGAAMRLAEVYIGNKGAK